MAPLTDGDCFEAYKDALSNWSYRGYVRFELNETAHKWLRTELDGITTDELSRLMFEYVSEGGEIDQVRETRPNWADYEFHYDLRFSVQDTPVYVETRLHFDPPFVPDESSILVVNVHAP